MLGVLASARREGAGNIPIVIPLTFAVSANAWASAKQWLGTTQFLAALNLLRNVQDCMSNSSCHNEHAERLTQRRVAIGLIGELLGDGTKITGLFDDLKVSLAGLLLADRDGKGVAALELQNPPQDLQALPIRSCKQSKQPVTSELLPIFTHQKSRREGG